MYIEYSTARSVGKNKKLRPQRCSHACHPSCHPAICHPATTGGRAQYNRFKQMSASHAIAFCQLQNGPQ
ncbi:hypothetical protein DM02DRAFT_617040 [Periconia macrospinosa]|uniref:Uncharacterized protein n=1 Tax=Periconia macrospinosa TaxID=97972 RepID=A0A2V1DHS6_9PLEO|nr:hypothetical protein DM02DRAFT_617040 [Periconia macrospinosa]